MAINLGDWIEVIGFEPGFEHSYYKGEVVGDHEGIFTIQYAELTEIEDGPLIREEIQADHVRPYPVDADISVPLDDHNFQRGDVVDVWYKDGWWDGVIHDVFYNMLNQKCYQVFFDYMRKKQRYGDYPPNKVRPHQDWLLINNERVWVSPPRVKIEEEVEITGVRRWR